MCFATSKTHFHHPLMPIQNLPSFYTLLFNTVFLFLQDLPPFASKFFYSFFGGRACHIHDNKNSRKTKIENELTCEYKENRLTSESAFNTSQTKSYHFKNTHGVQRTEPLQRHIVNKHFFKPPYTTRQSKRTEPWQKRIHYKANSKTQLQKHTWHPQFFNNKSAF